MIALPQRKHVNSDRRAFPQDRCPPFRFWDMGAPAAAVHLRGDERELTSIFGFWVGKVGSPVRWEEKLGGGGGNVPIDVFNKLPKDSF